MKSKQNGPAHGSKSKLANLLKNQPSKDSPKTLNASPNTIFPRNSLPEILKHSFSKHFDPRSLNEELCAVLATTHSIQHSAATKTASLYHTMGTQSHLGPSILHRTNFSNLLITTENSETLFTEGIFSMKNSTKVLTTEGEFNRTMNFARKLKKQHQSASSLRSSPKCSVNPSIAHSRNPSFNKDSEDGNKTPLMLSMIKNKPVEELVIEESKLESQRASNPQVTRKTRANTGVLSQPTSPKVVTPTINNAKNRNYKPVIQNRINKSKDPKPSKDEVIENIEEEKVPARQKSQVSLTSRVGDLKLVEPLLGGVNSARNGQHKRQTSATDSVDKKPATAFSRPRSKNFAKKNNIPASENKIIDDVLESKGEEVIVKVGMEKVIKNELSTSIILSENNHEGVSRRKNIEFEVVVLEEVIQNQNRLQTIHSETGPEEGTLKTTVEQQPKSYLLNTQSIPTFNLGISNIDLKEGDSSPHHLIGVEINFDRTPNISRDQTVSNEQKLYTFEAKDSIKEKELLSQERQINIIEPRILSREIMKTLEDGEANVVEGLTNNEEPMNTPKAILRMIGPEQAYRSPTFADDNQAGPEKLVDIQPIPVPSPPTQDMKPIKETLSSVEATVSSDSSDDSEEGKDKIGSQGLFVETQEKKLQLNDLERDSSKALAMANSVSHVTSSSPQNILTDEKRNSLMGPVETIGKHIQSFMKSSVVPWQNLKRRVSFIRSLIHNEKASSTHSVESKRTGSISSSIPNSRRRSSILGDRRFSNNSRGSQVDLSINVEQTSVNKSLQAIAYLAGVTNEALPKMNNNRKSLFSHPTNLEEKPKEKAANGTEQDKNFKLKFKFDKKKNPISFSINASTEKVSGIIQKKEAQGSFFEKLRKYGMVPKEDGASTTPLFADKSKLVDTKEHSDKQKTLDFSTLLQRYEDASPIGIGPRGTLMVKQPSTRSLLNKAPAVPIKTKLMINILSPNLDSTDEVKEKSNEVEKKKQFEFLLQGNMRGALMPNDFDSLESFDDIVEKDFNIEICYGEVGTKDQAVLFNFEEYFSQEYSHVNFFRYFQQLVVKKHPFAIVFYDEKLANYEENLVNEWKEFKSTLFYFRVSPTQKIMKVAPSERIETIREAPFDNAINQLTKLEKLEEPCQSQEDYTVYMNDLSFHKRIAKQASRELSLKNQFIMILSKPIRYKDNPVMIRISKEMLEKIDPDNGLTLFEYLAVTQLQIKNPAKNESDMAVKQMIMRTSHINQDYLAKTALDYYKKQLRGIFEDNYFVQYLKEPDLHMPDPNVLKRLSAANRMKRTLFEYKHSSEKNLHNAKDPISVSVDYKSHSLNAGKAPSSPFSASHNQSDNSAPLVAFFAQKMLEKSTKRRISHVKGFAAEGSFRIKSPAGNLLAVDSPRNLASPETGKLKEIKEETKAPPSSRFKSFARKALTGKSEQRHNDTMKNEQPSIPSITLNKEEAKNANNETRDNDYLYKSMSKSPTSQPVGKLVKEKSMRRIFAKKNPVQEDGSEKEKLTLRPTISKTNQHNEEGLIDPVELHFKFVKQNRGPELKELFNNYPQMEINIINDQGEAPIGIAAQSGFSNVIEILIQHNADVDVQNRQGNTPLHLALAFAYYDVADQLIAAGAQQNIRNKKGKTAWDLIL